MVNFCQLALPFSPIIKFELSGSRSGFVMRIHKVAEYESSLDLDPQHRYIIITLFPKISSFCCQFPSFFFINFVLIFTAFQLRIQALGTGRSRFSMDSVVYEVLNFIFYQIRFCFRSEPRTGFAFVGSSVRELRFFKLFLHYYIIGFTD